MSTTVVSANLVFTLPPAAFETALRRVLAEDPDICALQECGTSRDPIIRRVCKELGYDFARAKGGEPILWREGRYRFRSVRPIRLARAEYVGHLPGRKDRLPASIATEVCLDDLASKHPDGGISVVLDYHLTAEVQQGARYRRDRAHLLRVLRHRREKYRLGKRMRMHKRRGRDTRAAGDSNFDGFTVRGFVSCWKDRKGGTLGGRAVDVVLAARKPRDLDTIPTASDHDALVCVYP